MGAMDPLRWASFDPRGMICRIYVKLPISMLHTKYRSFGFLLFQRRKFLHVFPIIRLWQIMMPPVQGLYDPQGHSQQDF